MRNNYFKQSKADWHFCPRCNKRTIDKDNRRCHSCKGIVYWQGDDCQYAESRRDAYYIWMKNIWGELGWQYRTIANI